MRKVQMSGNGLCKRARQRRATLSDEVRHLRSKKPGTQISASREFQAQDTGELCKIPGDLEWLRDEAAPVKVNGRAVHDGAPIHERR